ncbi:3-oxoacyl-[acyl-carrier-protein] synthase-1 [Rhodobacter aestuarii]|uniref:3-oxoacyl-[acyl-carrier-protein] synthase-1 n=1 Tax=Rhodobacter aestuarii TaxID=453582 RepID=A0A1N7PKT5_9RHOB|nr:hypothetical protein [Rhodobacter aestuarii]PTV94333.1 3-oxoacyl-[acyl-carrier-protein] synthase-1 [Rhodobacter aestuarii]SIT11273.1 3-oxoacyl-[acyl-carrier-protein] synthase-1 [Rhodobacter aestuarii]
MSGLALLGCGMCSAIGLNAPAACAAFRARLDNFTETRFISQGGDWLLGAQVPLQQPLRGTARLVDLIAGPIRECFAQARSPAAEIPILLCLSETRRPGRRPGFDEALLEGLIAALDLPGPEMLRPYAFGQVGGAVALRDARALIASGTPEVIVAGVDSLLEAGALRHYDHAGRVLSENNPTGFMPGEAGAAVLLGATGGPLVRGIGFGVEEATLDSGQPLRAEGMVTAMRQALGEAGLDYGQISYRINDLTGEQYYFREATLAQTRLWRGKGDPEQVWTLADGMGHTGAAVVPSGLAVALTAARKGYAPGPIALYHGADDSGRRAAIVIEAA